jgi:hypothetical protein
MKPIIEATRIHILGNSGSGKTTLAKQLSLHLNIPFYELDEVAYSGFKQLKTPLQERLETLRSIVAQPAWITEGVYIEWTEMLFDCADLIVWLDLPMTIIGYRIVRRHFLWQPTGKLNPSPTIYHLIRFLLRTMRNQFSPVARVEYALDRDSAVTRIASQQLLRRYPEKVIHCKSTSQVANFRAQFGNCDLKQSS